MKHKLILLTFLIAVCVMKQANAQLALEQNKTYTGAQANELLYKAIYQMDQGSPEVIKKTIRNINNLLKDPRLKGKVQVELVVFSAGTRERSAARKCRSLAICQKYTECVYGILNKAQRNWNYWDFIFIGIIK